ncbi:class I SAM-dependent methyltransferase [Granulicella sp. WH15]|uniref:class I SAM-dependent methyltransferase n=1 Tax=Granulicella sp. WH15 TaxID=2602070 RepID=UPI001366EF1C|nr:class I SAM-dependent methyltransferase [Granulicella sp. WH15]QHN02226.1 class I SAM-dependent methyltransferase [Granulicella sp. WH15]
MVEPNFDLIARPYRWLEYLTLGRTLERAREHFLPRLTTSTQALILGDGDGRFTARLLRQNASIRIDAVDISAAMLHLLRQRAQTSRLTTHHTSALTYAPSSTPDLIATHFFLDCLTQPQVDELTACLAATLPPTGRWLVSDFRIPTGLMRAPAWLLIRSLYAAFRLLTGLRTSALPDHSAALERSGLTRIAMHRSLFGLITSELWQKDLVLPDGPPARRAGVHTPS